MGFEVRSPPVGTRQGRSLWSERGLRWDTPLGDKVAESLVLRIGLKGE